MIGVAGDCSRMARDTAIAVDNCGPPMTLTPTASMPSSRIVRTAVETKSRSMLPSTMVDTYGMDEDLPSSEADRLRTASGNRALRREVMVGLMSRMRRDVMTASAAH